MRDGGASVAGKYPLTEQETGNGVTGGRCTSRRPAPGSACGKRSHAWARHRQESTGLGGPSEQAGTLGRGSWALDWWLPPWRFREGTPPLGWGDPVHKCQSVNQARCPQVSQNLQPATAGTGIPGERTPLKGPQIWIVLRRQN